MTETQAPEGIDFFDFLFEVWRAKWMFLGIIAVAVLLAGAASMVLGRDGGSSGIIAPEVRYKAAIPVQINPVFDPYERETDPLWINLRTMITELDGKPIFNDHEIPDEATRPDLIFTPKLQKTGGMFFLDLKGGGLELAENFRTLLNEAAKTQLEQTIARVEADIALLDDITTNVYPRDSDQLAKEYYNYYRFLNLPSVKDGSHRFFSFGKVYETEGQVRSAGTGRSSTAKMLVLGAIIGFILASVAIMFRIAIRRKMNPIAEA